ncbi:uracil phosphoribosyltransferase [Algoriphagus namhaensis]
MFILNQQPSLANNFIAELRDVKLQKNPAIFRSHLRELGQIMAYELSKALHYESKEIQTPLALTQEMICSTKLVLVSILRASLPFYQGFLDYLPWAESAFVGAARVESEGQEVKVKTNYWASPPLDGKELILCDPMLATGKSSLQAIEGLLQYGSPSKIHFAAIFAAPEGIQYIQDHLNLPHDFWIGSLEEGLNDKFYIVPGLGDAGDLAFGQKL